jgi:3-hydroxyisobutyrate dehydrogenase-like beta-hydroxyacid dehydrogenase
MKVGLLGCGGVGAGASVDLLRAALHEGTAQTRMLDELLHASVLRGDFRPGLRLDLAIKDLDLVAELFEATGVGTELLERVRALYREAATRGWGDRSAHAVVRLFEESVGTTLRSKIFEQLPPRE